MTKYLLYVIKRSVKTKQKQNKQKYYVLATFTLFLLNIRKKISLVYFQPQITTENNTYDNWTSY